ncbi:molybdopterin-guanine dinucleotide biosynthesis protein B [Methylovulum psychrotolerans]|jgi:molybdopterin-guanine dinucleotide biosynthesis protein B|uniref:molybdopterin-guanine dinucleotide biosynthesis protein B n=1 Tax=Methylovulum psychrotolerans TaxID=1704499 RepID=UPI001BFF5308|nr:molybdopterin-guanine dinucleotide biosynthesis protein B [Methylovulum psychrotolerans]MBT9096537.1 molybdopterin-guanine dinucleotide biosynthesis protein B [Methylovulum psychrotolerans]
MQYSQIPVLGFVAASGTGKTTLLTALIPLLKNQGLRIGLIKHSHHDFQIDQPGKDSFRLRAAGASPVLLVSRHRSAMITDILPVCEPQLAESLRQFDQTGVDLVLVEGFKAEKFPKIELHRRGLVQPLLYPDDPDIIAVASDEALDLPPPLPCLDINRPQQLAEFIMTQVLAA